MPLLFLRPCSNLQVVTFNPGFHRTEINTNASAGLVRLWDRLDEHMKAEYGEHYIDAVVQSVDGFTKSMALNPVHVIDVRHPTPLSVGALLCNLH